MVIEIYVRFIRSTGRPWSPSCKRTAGSETFCQYQIAQEKPPPTSWEIQEKFGILIAKKGNLMKSRWFCLVRPHGFILVSLLAGYNLNQVKGLNLDQMQYRKSWHETDQQLLCHVVSTKHLTAAAKRSSDMSFARDEICHSFCLTVDWPLKLKSIHANFKRHFSCHLDLGRKWAPWLEYRSTWDFLPSWNGFIPSIAHLVHLYAFLSIAVSNIDISKMYMFKHGQTCTLMHIAHVKMSLKLTKKQLSWDVFRQFGSPGSTMFFALSCGCHLPLNQVVWTAQPARSHPFQKK